MDWRMTLDGTFSDFLSRRNVVRLLLFWLTGVVLVGFHAGVLKRSDSEAATVNYASASGRNQTGALTAWRKDSSSACTPAYRIAFDNLRAENASLGVFKTACVKVVHVENVRVVFFADGMASCDLGALLAPRQQGASGANPLGLFSEMEESGAEWSKPVDLANTTEVRIRRLDWRICRADRTVFHVRCQHATLRSDTSRMVLRGHVTMTTPDAVLQSNCVEIDTRDESIVAPGRYSLSCDGTVRVGQGARFSTTLEPTGGNSSEMEGDQGWANGLWLGSF